MKSDLPFPCWQSDHLLPAEFVHGLATEFPSNDWFENTLRVQGHRKNLGKWDSNLAKFLQTSPHWQKLHDACNCLEFVKSILGLAEADLKQNLRHFSLSKVSYSPYAFGYETPAALERERRLRKYGAYKLASLFLGNRYAVSFSITYADDGYSTPIHHDARHKLLFMIIYLNSVEEIGGVGGNLDLYRAKKPIKSIHVEGQDVDESEVELCATVEPKAGRAVLVGNTPNAFHGVKLIQGNNQRRKFLYLSIADRWDRNPWK